MHAYVGTYKGLPFTVIFQPSKNGDILETVTTSDSGAGVVTVWGKSSIVLLFIYIAVDMEMKVIISKISDIW